MSIAVDIRVFYVYVTHNTTFRYNFNIVIIGEWQLEVFFFLPKIKCSHFRVQAFLCQSNRIKKCKNDYRRAISLWFYAIWLDIDANLSTTFRIYFRVGISAAHIFQFKFKTKTSIKCVHETKVMQMENSRLVRISDVISFLFPFFFLFAFVSIVL